MARQLTIILLLVLQSRDISREFRIARCFKSSNVAVGAASRRNVPMHRLTLLIHTRNSAGSNGGSNAFCGMSEQTITTINASKLILPRVEIVFGHNSTDLPASPTQMMIRRSPHLAAEMCDEFVVRVVIERTAEDTALLNFFDDSERPNFAHSASFAFTCTANASFALLRPILIKLIASSSCGDLPGKYQSTLSQAVPRPPR